MTIYWPLYRFWAWQYAFRHKLTDCLKLQACEIYHFKCINVSFLIQKRYKSRNKQCDLPILTHPPTAPNGSIWQIAWSIFINTQQSKINLAINNNYLTTGNPQKRIGVDYTICITVDIAGKYNKKVSKTVKSTWQYDSAEKYKKS